MCNGSPECIFLSLNLKTWYSSWMVRQRETFISINITAFAGINITALLVLIFTGDQLNVIMKACTGVQSPGIMAVTIIIHIMHVIVKNVTISLNLTVRIWSTAIKKVYRIYIHHSNNCVYGKGRQYSAYMHCLHSAEMKLTDHESQWDRFSTSIVTSPDALITETNSTTQGPTLATDFSVKKI